MKVKKVLYWLSIVPPIFNIVRGAVKGIAEEVLKYSDNRRYLEELKKFNDSMKGD